MPPVHVPDALLVAASGTNLGTPWTNVIGLNTGGPLFTTQAHANAIGTAVRNLYGRLQSLMINDWQLNEVVVYDVQTVNAPSFEASITQLVGNVTANALAPNIAMCCTHRTALRGQSYRGRTFLGGWSIGAMDPNGQWFSTHRQTVIDSWDDFRTELATIPGTTLTHAVVSRTRSEVTDVVSTSINADVDHQDRRKP